MGGDRSGPTGMRRQARSKEEFSGIARGNIAKSGNF
jgi:hypothetical protein